MKPKISVVIPLYNKEASISKTIDSVLAQEFKDFEIVIVNDGSTDNSLQVLEEINDERIRLFSKENGGVSEARNYGVMHATGEWIFFLDADDDLYNNCLSVFYNLIQDYPEHKFFTANYIAKYPDGKEVVCCSGKKRGVVNNPFKSVWQRNVFPRMGSMLIKKEAFLQKGAFRKECVVWEDLESVLNLLVCNALVYDPTIVFIHNLEHNELSQKLKPLEKEYAFYVELGKTTNLYHKLILLELLVRTEHKRQEIGDEQAADLMSKKIGMGKPLLFLGKTERYLLKHLRQ